MGVEVARRHGFELRARSEVAAWRPQPAEAPPVPSADYLGILKRAAWAAAAAVALAVAVWYGVGRGPALSANTPPIARLALAAALGVALTIVHQRVRGTRSVGYSLARAQILLCVAGALTMILIDNSVARAFGIAGAASIVRFRTPVEDPTDATVLFLAMALGMASGVGALGLAIAGTAGICLLLAAFGTFVPEPRKRHITIDVLADGHEFPSRHVGAVFARHQVAAEPSEWSQEDGTRVRYRAAVDDGLPLERLGAELMARGQAGVRAVSWEIKKNP